jgi:accessory gene regulator protein AgrB
MFLLRKKKILIILILLLVNFVLAQNGIDEAEDEILRILGNIINFLFSVLMILGSLLLIILGIFLIVSGKEKYQILGQEVEARQAFRYLILGIVLLILSLFIPNLIKNFIETSIQ